MDIISRTILSFVVSVSIVHTVSANDAATLKTIIERIARLEERDRVQQNEINRLEERDHYQLKRIAQLEVSDSLQKKKIDIFTENSKLQQQEIMDMRKQLLLQTRNTTHCSSMRTRHMEAQKSKRHVPKNKLVNEVEDTSYESNHPLGKSVPMGRMRRAENEEDVAFFATLTSHQTHIGVNQAILFDHVVTNIGNAYHNTLGSFIVPVSGTYVISVSVLSNKQATYTISKHGRAVSYILADASKYGLESTSQTVILSLNQNDDISIRNVHAEGWTNGNHYSTFAGFLLKQTYSDKIVG